MKGGEIMALIRPISGGAVSGGYTFPFTITLTSGHTASAPQGVGGSVSFPIIGSLLKNTKTITASFESRTGLVTGACNLLDVNGNSVITLTSGTNDVSTYTDAQWESIVSFEMAGSGYTGANSLKTIGTATFSDT